MRTIRVLAVIICFLYFTPRVSAQSSTVFSDGFEAGNLANWDAETPPWYINNYDPHSGTYYVTSDNTNEGAIISDSMDTSDASSIDIVFWYRHVQTEANDFVFSLWDGTQFVDYADLSTMGGSEWNLYTTEVLDPNYFVADFKIRFFTNLASGEYVFLDDIIITKNTGIYTITYDVNGKGSIQSTPSGPYSNGVDVNLLAVPNNGWSFSTWAGDLSGTSNPDTLTITGNMAVTATFVPTSYIQVSTSRSSYNRLEKVTLQITDGTPFGSVLIQINQGTTVVLIDQRELNSGGSLNYVFKIPSTWAHGTYTIRVKDGNTDTNDASNFQVPVPSPPPSPPPSGGGSVGGPSSIFPDIMVIKLLSAKDASKLLDDFDPDKVANLLVKLENETHIIWIIHHFKPSYAFKVIQELGKEYSAEIMNKIQEDTASRILAEFRSGDAAIIESMLNNDFNHTSELIERSVKIIESMDEPEKQEYRDGFGSMLKLMNKTMLIESLIFIHDLPETPSTVVSIIDIMDTTNVLELISIWLENPSFADSRNILGGLFELLSPEKVSTYYMGIDGSLRIVLLDHLSDSVISSLPMIGLFEVSQLRVHQVDIVPGDTIEFSYTLKNAGEETDDYVIPVDIDGEIIITDEGILQGLESTSFEHSVLMEKSGTYTLTVLGETITFGVEQKVIPVLPSPAEIITIALEVVPNLVERGKMISIFITLENLGELGGMREIPLYVDSSFIESKEVFIIANGQMTLIFNLPAEYGEGSHEILVGGETGSFEIYKVEQGRNIPYLTAFTVIAIIAIGAYYIRNRSDLNLREILGNIIPRY